MSSADVIGSNDDIITEILLHLPAKSLVKFKLVSRKWLSLISDPNFVLRHCRQSPKTVSGFILAIVEPFDFKCPPTYMYMSLYENKNQNQNSNSVQSRANFPSFDPSAPGAIMISQSCNGLLLCYSQRYGSPAPCVYYVFNPATNKFSILPEPICHEYSEIILQGQAMPRPPLPENWNSDNFRHFMECQGHLLFIDFDSPEYVIYEMENDCSKWFVKYRLDINLIVTAFPDEMINDKENNSSISLLELEEFISPVSLVEVENEGSLLVMYIPGRFIAYRFKDNTFKTIRE
ncbi:hypothetical protein CCACVL1_11948, partial [Corchorus capsularis]